MTLHLAPSPARPADPVAEAHHQMACAALLQVVQVARYRLWARVYLLSDQGRAALEAVGVEPEAAWERMVAEWMRRGQGGLSCLIRSNKRNQ